MKKFFSILFVLFFSLAGFSKDKPFKLQLKIDGMQDSTCYLLNYYGSKMYYNDTAQFNSQGVVVFNQETQPKGGLYIVYTGGKRLFELIINNENNIELATDTSDYVGKMNVKKSKENTVFFDYLKFLSKKQKDALPLQNQLKNKEISEKEKKKINTQLAATGEAIKEYRADAIAKNNDLFVSVFFKAMNETVIPPFESVKNDSLKKLLNYR
mgnify:CR=1 FL=1